MPWEQKGNKVVYKFPRYKGWRPSQEIIASAEDTLYDVKNVRVADGIIKRRGGWSQLSTGDTNVNGLFWFEQGSGTSALVSTNGDGGASTLRMYDTAWLTVDRVRGEANSSFAAFNQSDGDDVLVVVDGTNENIQWDGDIETSPRPLGSMEIFDASSDEGWNDYANNQSTTHVKGGKYSIKLTATNTDVVSAYIEFTESTPPYEYGTPSNTNADTLIGDISNTERDFARWVPLSDALIFDSIDLSLTPANSPTGNITVTCETDSGGVPSGVLIHANATNGGEAGPSGAGWWTATLGGQITYSQGFWIVIAAADQATSAKWQINYQYTNNVSQLVRTDGGSWTGHGANRDTAVKVYDTTVGGLVLNASGYDLYDDIVLHVYFDDVTKLDITDVDNSYIKVQGNSRNNKFRLFDANADQTIQDGWNTLVIPLSHEDWITADSFVDADWGNIERITLYVGEGTGSTINAYFSECYLRKTRVDQADGFGAVDQVGSKTRPPKAYYTEVSPVGDRLLLANTDPNVTNSGSQYLYYSDAYELNTFTNDQFVAFPEAIKGIKTFGEFVFVFGTTQRWIMQPNYAASDWTANANALDWRIAKGSGPGTVSHRSIAEGTLKDQRGLFYLAQDGVWFTNGMSAAKVSNSIDILFTQKFSTSSRWYNESFSENNWNIATGTYYENKYFLAYYPNSQADNEYMLVLDSKTGEWSLDIMSGAVFPINLAVGTDTNLIPQLYAGADNGEVYQYAPSRATQTDDGSTFTSHFQTPYIGLDVLSDIQWEQLFLWIKSDETDALDIRVECFDLNEGATSYDDWAESSASAQITTSTTLTPVAFKWRRVKIPLIDKDTATNFLRSRAVSFKIYENNGEPIDIIPELVVCELGRSELE